MPLRAGEEMLYNGIRLPEEWPPRGLDPDSREPLPVATSMVPFWRPDERQRWRLSSSICRSSGRLWSSQRWTRALKPDTALPMPVRLTHPDKG